MNTKDHLRIIWTIAAKDIVDAIRNKILLGILVSIGFLMLSSQAIGFIARFSSEPVAYLFDPGGSAVTRSIAAGSDGLLVRTESRDSMIGRTGSSPDPALGMEFPPDLDAKLAAGEAVRVETYAAARLSSNEVSDLVNHFERVVHEAAPSITLEAAPIPAYPPPDSSDYPMMIGFGMVLGVMLIGIILTPYLVMDEKTGHTLDAMLVSPAGYNHLMVGKLIAGMAYSVVGSLVVILVSRDWFMHWGLVMGAVLSGAVCAVLIGLLLGSLFNHSASLNMLGGGLAGIIMLPMYFWPQLTAQLSPVWSRIVSLIPSIPMYRMVRLAMVESPEPGAVFSQLAILVGISGMVFLLLQLQIKRIARA